MRRMFVHSFDNRPCRFSRAARYALCVFSAAAFIAPAIVVHADDTLVRKQLQTQLDAIAAAFRKKDIAGAVRYFTPDYTTRDANGKVYTLAEYKTRLTHNFSVITTMNGVAASIRSLEVTGNKAITEDREKLEFTATAPDGVGGKNQSHRVQVSSVSRHTWVKTGGKWLIQKNEDLPGTTMRVDGKEVPPLGKSGGSRK